MEAGYTISTLLRHVRLPGLRVAGKTGTAEFHGPRNARGELPTHGWYTGFAPADKPEIAVTVFVELGTGSNEAAPIASQIFRKYFNLPDVQPTPVPAPARPPVAAPRAAPAGAPAAVTPIPSGATQPAPVGTPAAITPPTAPSPVVAPATAPDLPRAAVPTLGAALPAAPANPSTGAGASRPPAEP
jgi:hypothetical protein